jgi:hypothetical protein
MIAAPATKREALKMALMLAITAPDDQPEKKADCIRWAKQLAQLLGEDVTKEVQAEIMEDIQ